MSVVGLPLFDWRPKAQVLPFPAYRRSRLVCLTAARLLKERDSVALAQAIELVKQALAPANLNEGAIWQHVWAFHHAVQAEIRRLDQREPPRSDLG